MGRSLILLCATLLLGLTAAQAAGTVVYRSGSAVGLGAASPGSYFADLDPPLTVVLGTNATTATLTASTSRDVPAESVSATEGTCSGCTAAAVAADDGSEAAATAAALGRAVLRMDTGAPPGPWASDPAQVEVTYRGRASESLAQKLQVYKVSTATWTDVASGTFSVESTLSATLSPASAWVASDGSLDVRLYGPVGGVLGYTVYADMLRLVYRTDNGTATWTAVVRLTDVADGTGIELVAESVSVTNAARFGTVDVRAGASGRLLFFGNGTVEQQALTGIAVADGASVDLKVVQNVAAGSTAGWVFRLVASAPDGGWSVRHTVVWRLSST